MIYGKMHSPKMAKCLLVRIFLMSLAGWSMESVELTRYSLTTIINTHCSHDRELNISMNGLTA